MAVSKDTSRSTKERILESALQLFNDSDPASVSTTLLAEQAGISEGNLHYHFRRKLDLVAALFELYETEARRLLSEDPTAWETPFDLYRYQQSWFELIWQFRFLHRGSCQLGRLPEELRDRGWAIQQDIQNHVRKTLTSWSHAGYIDLKEGFEALIANLWIVSHYWMDYLAMSQGATATRDDLKWGLEQMEALCRPYVTPAGLNLLEGRVH